MGALRAVRGCLPYRAFRAREENARGASRRRRRRPALTPAADWRWPRLSTRSCRWWWAVGRARLDICWVCVFDQSFLLDVRGFGLLGGRMSGVVSAICVGGGECFWIE